MYFPFIEYDEPLFRPPSEALSLILQATYGCSWNKCAFCEMYKSKQFRVKPENDLFKEIDYVAETRTRIKKVFLADGDALVLSTDKLIRILDRINEKLNPVRITAYAVARNVRDKSIEDLKLIREKGLQMVYVGVESGCNDVLNLVNKGETYDSTKEALLKLKEAGIKSSVMILTGLGGKEFMESHAIQSAKLMNETNPEYLSTLVLSYPYGVDHFKKSCKGDFQEPGVLTLLKELRLFIQHTELNNTVFRSDHASNYLVLKGFLSRDKERFLQELDFAINNQNRAGLRPEWLRGL